MRRPRSSPRLRVGAATIPAPCGQGLGRGRVQSCSASWLTGILSQVGVHNSRLSITVCCEHLRDKGFFRGKGVKRPQNLEMFRGLRKLSLPRGPGEIASPRCFEFLQEEMWLLPTSVTSFALRNVESLAQVREEGPRSLAANPVSSGRPPKGSGGRLRLAHPPAWLGLSKGRTPGGVSPGTVNKGGHLVAQLPHRQQ